MEKSPSVHLYPRAKPVSTLPQAILIWPSGLTGPPEVFPIGSSLEENERIQTILKEAFTRRLADRGILDELPAA